MMFEINVKKSYIAGNMFDHNVTDRGFYLPIHQNSEQTDLIFKPDQNSDQTSNISHIFNVIGHNYQIVI